MYQERLVYFDYVQLPEGVSQWTVSGLGMKFDPGVVFCTINLPPAGGIALNPKGIGRPTRDGFLVDLGGTTDNDQYVLGFYII